MEGTVSVVEISVLKDFFVSLVVKHIHGHGVGVSREDRGFVHVVPEGVKMVGSFEVFVQHLLSPVVLGVLIQKVDPS